MEITLNDIVKLQVEPFFFCQISGQENTIEFSHVNGSERYFLDVSDSERQLCLMAHSHCTGPGTGTGQRTGPGTGCSVHIAVQGMVQGIGETYGLVPDPVVKWVWNPSVPCPVPIPGLGAVCTVHRII